MDLLWSIRWGPLVEHVLLFALLVTLSTLVYNGMRRENLSEIIRIGLGRSLFFVIASLAAFGIGGLLLVEWL